VDALCVLGIAVEQRIEKVVQRIHVQKIFESNSKISICKPFNFQKIETAQLISNT
jgi:hypothetical protein